MAGDGRGHGRNGSNGSDGGEGGRDGGDGGSTGRHDGEGGKDGRRDGDSEEEREKRKSWGQRGIEPRTSSTLRRNHTTRPLSRSVLKVPRTLIHKS